MDIGAAIVALLHAVQEWADITSDDERRKDKEATSAARERAEERLADLMVAVRAGRFYHVRHALDEAEDLT